MKQTKSKIQKNKSIKKEKDINYICIDCAKQLYPKWVLCDKNLNGITVHEGECNMCGKTKILTPIRDYLYVIGEAIGIERKMWD